jgi:glucosamine kinase
VPVFLGIDGGGTQTTCGVGDESDELARAAGPGSNPIRVGEEQSRTALLAVIEQACSQAGVHPQDVQAVCVGIAGGAREPTGGFIRSVVAEVTKAPTQVVGDNVIAFEAAFGEAPGVIVIAGTGSMAFGRNGAGQTWRAGGWGSAISDEGSAHWIGRAAVSAAMRAHDAGETTLLVSSILNTWHLGTRDDVVRFANSMPPPDFAALFPAVLAVSQEGDAVAGEILMKAGSELAQLAKIVVRCLWPSHDPALRVALAGGVLRSSSLVRQVFSNSLRSEFARVELRPGMIDAVYGALAMARKFDAGRTATSG